MSWEGGRLARDDGEEEELNDDDDVGSGGEWISGGDDGLYYSTCSRPSDSSERPAGPLWPRLGYLVQGEGRRLPWLTSTSLSIHLGDHRTLKGHPPYSALTKSGTRATRRWIDAMPSLHVNHFSNNNHIDFSITASIALTTPSAA